MRTLVPLFLTAALVATMSMGLAAQEKEATEVVEKHPFVSAQIILSGPGVIDDTTIAAGQPVTLEFHLTNDQNRRGLSMGFEISSDDIEKIVHVADSGNGMTPLGDIKAYNGFETNQYFDLKGLWININAWSGDLPDTVGFAGLNLRTVYPPHPLMKAFTCDIMVPTPGTLVVDSTFCRPGITWKAFDMEEKEEYPTWHGPYNFKVVQK
jgi:hypothetical protein